MIINRSSIEKYFFFLCLLIISSQIIHGLINNYKRFRYPLVEFPFYLKQDYIVTETDSFNTKFINKFFDLTSTPWKLFLYPSIFGFNHSFARGCYQIFSEGYEGNIETIKVFTQNGKVPSDSDRSGILKPLNLHVVYGDLGIIYYKITKSQSLDSLDYNDRYWLDNLFNFSGIRYFNQTGSYPIKSTLVLNTINIPTKFIGYYNGVNKNNIVKITYNHKTNKMKLIHAPNYSHNFNQVELNLFESRKIRFFLD